MNRSSYFIKNKAIFGCFPSQSDIKELEEEGVKYFVNLTFNDENKIIPYKTKYNYISFPIKDRSIPINNVLNQDFTKFIFRISKIIIELKNDHKIYIHCKGGHGRSGIVVAILLCHIFNFSPSKALEHTTKSHNNRLIMREKWRKIGSPQTYHQKLFVYNFCKPIFFCKSGKSGKTSGFSNFSPHSVLIPNKGIFPTAEAAFQSYKSDDPEYIQKQINSISPNVSRFLGNQIISNKSWKEKIPSVLLYVLKCKFRQHLILRENLIISGISPLIYSTKLDDILGNGNGDGDNLLGKTLVILRNYFLQN